MSLLKQQERVDRIGLGVRADIPRRQLPDVNLPDVELLAAWREAGGLNCFAQQALILAGQTVARAERVEAVGN